MFENEWFPVANSMGVSWAEFWHMNPHIINLLTKGHREKLKEIDYMNWLNNQYTLSAVMVAVERNLAGKKAKSKYAESPIMQKIESNQKQTGGHDEPLSDEEKKRQTEQLFMRLRIMGANFNLNKEE